MIMLVSRAQHGCAVHGSRVSRQAAHGPGHLCRLVCHARRRTAHTTPAMPSLSEDGPCSSRPLDISRRLAWARYQETLRGPAPECSAPSQASSQHALFVDVYAEALLNTGPLDPSAGAVPATSTTTSLLDVLSTAYLDETLLNALAATNVNSINKGDYRQVVLVGDGFDTRPFRLPWPDGTIIFLVAPPESHELAEAVLKSKGAHVPRTCLLRRVNAPLHRHTSLPVMVGHAAPAAPVQSGSEAAADEDPFVPFLSELEKAGYQGNKLSVWVLQGIPYCISPGAAGGSSSAEQQQQQQQHVMDMLRLLLAEVGNCAAFNSLVMGELPHLTRKDGENLIAEAGLLSAVVDFSSEVASCGRLPVAADAEGGCGGAALAEQSVRRLFTGQQLRLSFEEMGVYERYVAVAEEVDEEFDGRGLN